MFSRKSRKPGLYYLLPGMTRANREKRKRIFWWSVFIGLLAAAVIAGLIWTLNRSPHP